MSPFKIFSKIFRSTKKIYVPVKYWDGFEWRMVDETIKFEDLETITGDLCNLRNNLTELREVIVDYHLEKVVGVK
jgi:hypothetical protein